MHYIVLYPQNGDRIVTIDAVTSLHPMYRRSTAAMRSEPATGGCVIFDYQ